jgi:hypothetical protein
MSDRGRGRPPVYAALINGVKVNDGWVDVCPQQNRTAPSGYRARYPDNDFRVVPTTLEDQQTANAKPYMLQTRRMRKAEKDARVQKAAARHGGVHTEELADAVS